MESVVETIKGGFGELGRGSSGDESWDGFEGLEGFIGVFIMESFGSIDIFLLI
jgi:hypothetical protein